MPIKEIKEILVHRDTVTTAGSCSTLRSALPAGTGPASWEKGCDLLVMGAYTHSARGFVLGAHAKDILRHMTLPVLMAH